MSSAHRDETRAEARARRRSWRQAHVFHPHGFLDWVFMLGIIGKGLNGLGELVGGVALPIVGVDRIHRFLAWATAAEVQEDPNSRVAAAVRGAGASLNAHDITFVTLYLLVHGIVKVVLFVAVLFDQLWAFPWMIAALVGFIAYQCYELSIKVTPGMLGLTIVDVLIVALTVRDWRQQKRKLAEQAAGGAPADGGQAVGAAS